jgi:hypothetical protein
VLLGTPLQASLSPHLLNVLVQIANKQGLQKKKLFETTSYASDFDSLQRYLANVATVSLKVIWGNSLA